MSSNNLSGAGLARLVEGLSIDAEPPKSTRHEDNVGPKTYIMQIVWESVIFFTYMHIGALYGLYLIITQAKLATIFWFFFTGLYTALGITAGVHRYWAHKTYKAKLPLRLLLAFFNTSSFQYPIYKWAREHRTHHKFTDTDADPYNSTRGLFFSHLGWVLVRKHPDVIAKGKLIDMSDLERDAIVMWQKKLYPILMPLCTYALPTWVPWYFWAEDGSTSWHVTLLRYILIVHADLMVNSVAHRIGSRPYDKNIRPTDSTLTSICAFGEGWHNYHHVFPWDYKTSEYSGYKMNVTTAFIDFFARIGWAYDLKTAKTDMIIKRASRTGDGSHELTGEMSTNKADSYHRRIKGDIWGLEDKDMKEEDKEIVETLHPIPPD